MSILAYVVALIVSVFGYTAPANRSVDLCNGVSVDNVDRVVYVYPEGYIVHMRFDDPYTNIVILDNCFDQSAWVVSPSGIEYTDF